MADALVLVETSDDDFARMAARAQTLASGLTLPPDGMDTGATLGYLRALAAKLANQWFRAAWTMVAANEGVGLLGFKAPPNAAGEVEIGYGVAASRRRRGHASRAVALVIEIATNRDDVEALLAETAFENVTSQRVLESNGFERTGIRLDPSESELIGWRRATPR